MKITVIMGHARAIQCLNIKPGSHIDDDMKVNYEEF
jgi:hypothetical protein